MTIADQQTGDIDLGKPDPTHPAPAAQTPRDFGTLPATEQQRIRSNIQLMQSKGAKPEEIDDYLGNHERLAPVSVARPRRVGPAVGADATAAAPDQAGRRAASAAAPPLLSSGLAREAEQGATLGFGDEINAGVRRVVGGQSYDAALADERAKDQAYESAHPIASIGAQLAGGAVTGAGAARIVGPAAATASRAVKAARIVGGGAAIGAVAGAGNANGDLSDRVTGAERGAAAGAVIAPVAAAAGRYVIKPAASAAADLVGLRAPAAATAPLLEDRAGVQLSLPQKAARRVGVGSVQDRGDNLVLSTIEKGGKSIDDLRAAATGASADKPITLADIGGEGSQQLVAGARGYGGSAASSKVPQVIRNRAEGAGARISNDMTQASGIQPANPYQLAQQMSDVRAKEAAQLYNTAYAKGAVPDETIQDMLKLPYFKDAYGFAKNLATLDGRQLPERITSLVEKAPGPPTPPGFSDEQWAAARAKLPDNEVLNPPDVVKQGKETVPDVEALDMVKRGVDKQIQRNLEKGGIDETAAVKLQQRLHEFLGRVDTAVPEYGQARAAYAEKSRYLDALASGRRAVSSGADPRAVQMELQGLASPHEQALYRLGMQDELGSVIRNTRDGAPIASKVAGTQDARSQLALIAKDGPSAQDLLKRSGEERNMADVNSRILGGSNTAEKLGARSAIDDASTDLPSKIPTTAGGAVKYLYGRVRDYASGLNANTADAVANRLLAGTTNRQELLDALDQLDALKKKGTLTQAKTRELLKLPAATQAARVVGGNR